MEKPDGSCVACLFCPHGLIKAQWEDSLQDSSKADLKSLYNLTINLTILVMFMQIIRPH